MLLFIEEATIVVDALGWLGVFSLLALWSLVVWASHSITAWTVSHAGVLAAGGAVAGGGLRMPDWLAPWMPPDLARALDSSAAAVTPAIEAGLAWAPALAGGLSMAVWVIWGIGSGFLVVLGFLATGLIAALRPRLSVPATPSGRPAAER